MKKMIKLAYPYGFEDHLVRFTNRKGGKVSALPLETDEKYYLVEFTLWNRRQQFPSLIAYIDISIPSCNQIT